jgi:hypothetical protein
MAADTNAVWSPLFEFQDWTYQSTLVLPTAEETAASAGTTTTAKKWTKGTLALGQAFKAANDGYTLSVLHSFAPGIELSVSAKDVMRSENEPATFEAIGTGTEGITKGSVYELFGWVFAEKPINNNAGRVLSIRGRCGRYGPRQQSGERTRRDAPFERSDRSWSRGYDAALWSAP